MTKQTENIRTCNEYDIEKTWQIFKVLLPKVANTICGSIKGRSDKKTNCVVVPGNQRREYKKNLE